MIDAEDQLRREMRTEAERIQADRVRPLRMPAPRRRSRTIRWLAPLTAAAAVAGIISGVAIAGHSNNHRPAPQALPAGAPKYYLTLQTMSLGGTRFAVTAIVRSSATGAPVSSVQLLRSPSLPQPLVIAGAANDRTFLVSFPGGLEIIRVSAGGHVLGLTRLPGIAGLNTLAAPVLSPDGTEVVAAVGPLDACKSCEHGVVMVSVATGATTKWLLPAGNEAVWSPVNWPANGHEVLLSGGLGNGFRTLNAGGPAGRLLAASRVIHAPDPLPAPVLRQGWVAYGGDSWLMPGGTTLLTAYARISTAGHGRSAHSVESARILQTSGSTGRLVRVLASFSVPVPANAGIGCLPVSLGPTGVHVLMWCVNGFGRLDGTRFTPLPGPSKDLAATLAAAW